jgi:hypothetical protein
MRFENLDKINSGCVDKVERGDLLLSSFDDVVFEKKKI